MVSPLEIHYRKVSSCDKLYTLNVENLSGTMEKQTKKKQSKAYKSNQRKQNSLFVLVITSMHVKFSDRTEKRFIVQQCFLRISISFCSRHERLQAENRFISTVSKCKERRSREHGQAD